MLSSFDNLQRERSNNILIRFQGFAALEVKLIFYDPCFFKQAPFPRVFQGKCPSFKSRRIAGNGPSFCRETAHGALPPSQSGQINFLKHKCGHKMNKVMAFHEKAPDYIENMLQLYVK